MVRIEAFLSLENSVAGTINAVMRKVTAKAVDQLMPLVEEGKWDDAHDVANRLSLNGVVSLQRRRLEELAVSALLFGAQNVAGSPAATSFVRGEQPLPLALQQALDQLTEMVETLGAEQVRNAIHAFVREREIVPFEKSDIRKADQALADMLNAAVMGTGRMQADLSANLTTSRLVTLGFLAEAQQKSITTYQVNEVLDSRTCPVCQYMHGKTFDVAQEYTRVLTALGTSDPKELKAIAPWPSQSKAGLRDLSGMTLSQMQSAGFGSPPYHPLCRGVLAITGTVTEQIQLGKLVPVQTPEVDTPEAPDRVQEFLSLLNAAEDVAMQNLHTLNPNYVDAFGHFGLSHYLDDGYAALTDHFMSGAPLSSDGKRALASMKALIKPLEEDARVYRGMRGEGFAMMDAMSEGDIVDMPSFTSTSTSAFRAASFGNNGVVVRIDLPPGTPAIVTNEEEAEIILPPGRKLRILRKTSLPEGNKVKLLVEAELV